MVKKIRLVDKPDGDVTKTTGSGGDGSNPALMELLKSMNWKLWELLQIAQRWEAGQELAKKAEEDDTKKSESTK